MSLILIPANLAVLAGNRLFVDANKGIEVKASLDASGFLHTPRPDTPGAIDRVGASSEAAAIEKEGAL